MITNPFQPTKFEWEKEPVIWLSSRAKNFVSSIKPVYISGSRGSGKTTLLRSLSTRQIAKDDLLREQFGPRRLGWFGQYLQFNSTFQEKTDAIVLYLGEPDEESELTNKVFYTYFEISVLLQFFNDILFFQENEFLHFKSKVEKNACEELNHIFNSAGWENTKKLTNFQDSRRFLSELQGEFLKTKTEFDKKFVSKLINSFKPGDLIRFIKDFAISSIQSTNFIKGENLDFFLLIDDCEGLSDRQQIALNTYIRTTEGVAKWVICYLSDRFNTTATNIRNTSLTGDDREIIALNDMSEKDFSDFCEQVTNLRLIKFLERNGPSHISKKTGRFNFEDIFGSFSYNALIDALISDSSNRKLDEFRRLVNGTKGVLSAHIKKSLHSRFSCEVGSTPYIEHLVIEALELNLQNYALPEEQLSLMKTIDGKQAAAYIAFCANYNLKPIYAGSNYIKAISDCCIRDFLDIMAIFFKHFSRQDATTNTSKVSLGKGALRFMSGERISYQAQDRAIQEASRNKYVSLEQSRVAEPHIERIVLSIANLQRGFEHDLSDWTSIKVPTRGRFVVELPRTTDNVDPDTGVFGIGSLRDVLIRLEYDRYIKILSAVEGKKSVELRFALHRRLRPFIRCGHSGPYDPLVPISPKWLLEALNGDESFSPERWAAQKYHRISAGTKLTDVGQTELPL